MNRGIFVTGTDTGVGKTVVTAALAGALRRRGTNAGVMKAVQTGALRAADGAWISPDGRFLAATAGVDDPPELVCPVCLELPLAPAVAAALSGDEVPIGRIMAAFEELCRRHDLVLVEGAGGLAVPIRSGYLMSDLARDLGLPLLIVARPGLGTLNHTALTVHFARSAGLRVLGVVFGAMPPPEEQDAPMRSNAAAIEAVAGVPVLGFVPRVAGVDVDAGSGIAAAAAAIPDELVEALLAALKVE